MLNLVQLQERLKDLPMQAIMQYANGANPQIPPFLALGELNRRKKMQESAAAEQAKEMAGAPSIKEQIEQATGLMSLQNQQRPQQMPQQMPPQAMPQQAPVQMAGGGMARSQGMNPEMIKKLMMLAAMKKRGGIDQLPMRKDMFRRGDYAGGGIVAFQNGGAADVINAAVDASEQADEEIGMTPEEKRYMDVIRRLKAIKSLEERKKEAGIGAPPDAQAERIRALEEQQRRFGESDTVARRVLALDPRRIGKSMDEYFTRRETAQKDFEGRLAEIKDLREKAKYDASVGDLTKARAEEIEALEKERNILKDMGEAGYKRALREQAEAGKSTNLKDVYKTELAGLAAEGKDPNSPVVQREAMRRAAALVTTYAGPRVELGERSRISGLESQAVKEFNDIFDPRKVLFGELSDQMDAAAARDKKEKTGTRYQDAVKLRKYNEIRVGMGLAPESSLPGSSVQQKTSSNNDPLNIRR